MQVLKLNRVRRGVVRLTEAEDLNPALVLVDTIEMDVQSLVQRGY